MNLLKTFLSFFKPLGTPQYMADVIPPAELCTKCARVIPAVAEVCSKCGQSSAPIVTQCPTCSAVLGSYTGPSKCAACGTHTQPVAELKECSECMNMVSVYRTYGNGKIECIPCSTKRK